jgi:rifampicin phosphotransferase
MGSYVLGFQEVDQTQVAIVGGKGAHLGELSRIEGIRVPPGFCVTTDAFQRIMAEAPSIEERLDRLSRLHPADREAIRTLSAEIRRTLEGIAIPDDLAAAISHALARLGEQTAYAVRSSATAEDLPAASFAGQQDTYLNVVGPAAILRRVSRCWASLFTERAVTYRLRNSVDDRKIHMAVVVQQMVFPRAAGVLFTADPVTSDRKVVSVEATFGLGEALVSGLVDADAYKVRDGEVVARAVATKRLAIHALPAGGTQEQAIDLARQEQPALTDAQVVRLAQLGRRIEAHFGRPQDIEWCLVDDGFQIVQSRPITTLFPIPDVGDQENHVFISVGHGQMMTDAMKPLGISFWQLTTPRPMYVAGGRLFVDVAPDLGSPARRAGLLEVFGRSDPLIGDALQTILERDGFVRSVPDEAPGGVPAVDAPAPIETDPAIVTELIGHSQASVAALQREIGTKSGSALLDFILADIQELKRILFDRRSHQVFMGAMEAAWWLNEQLEEWLGEKNVADTLTQSVPHNITSEMGLALLDVADVIRPHPEVVAFLQDVEDDGFLDGLAGVAGGREARDAIQVFLDRYGMRCVGEIDITRPRWSERPTTLLPVLLGNVKNFEPGAGARRFEQGRQEAEKKEQDVLERLQALPGGERKAEEVKRMIDRVRTFIGYREYPKYGMVSRYFVYKQALLEEAERLVQAKVIGEKEDIFYLRFHELHDVVRTHQADDRVIRRRKDELRSFQALTPPRVLTSDGEVVAGVYRRDDVPAGALAGLPVSAGTVEGRARVIRDLAEAAVEAGDILVTAYTDPSWSPLFVAVMGLVTEVGGLMTHGAVIAREYGLPAVVGVEHATRLIRDWAADPRARNGRVRRATALNLKRSRHFRNQRRSKSASMPRVPCSQRR